MATCTIPRPTRIVQIPIPVILRCRQQNSKIIEQVLGAIFQGPTENCTQKSRARLCRRWKAKESGAGLVAFPARLKARPRVR
jgi:hypothetical protein